MYFSVLGDIFDFSREKSKYPQCTEKCTFCIQRIRRTKRDANVNGFEIDDGSRAINPACVNACPTEALVFGDMNDSNSKVSKIKMNNKNK